MKKIKARRMWIYAETAGNMFPSVCAKRMQCSVPVDVLPAAAASRAAMVEQAANALACEHMGAMEGSYSLTPEKDCRKGSESEYMWRSARAVLRSLGLAGKGRGK